MSNSGRKASEGEDLVPCGDDTLDSLFLGPVVYRSVPSSSSTAATLNAFGSSSTSAVASAAAASAVSNSNNPVATSISSLSSSPIHIVQQQAQSLFKQWMGQIQEKQNQENYRIAQLKALQGNPNIAARNMRAVEDYESFYKFLQPNVRNSQNPVNLLFFLYELFIKNSQGIHVSEEVVLLYFLIKLFCEENPKTKLVHGERPETKYVAKEGGFPINIAYLCGNSADYLMEFHRKFAREPRDDVVKLQKFILEDFCVRKSHIESFFWADYQNGSYYRFPYPEFKQDFFPTTIYEGLDTLRKLVVEYAETARKRHSLARSTTTSMPTSAPMVTGSNSSSSSTSSTASLRTPAPGRR